MNILQFLYKKQQYKILFTLTSFLEQNAYILYYRALCMYQEGNIGTFNSIFMQIYTSIYLNPAIFMNGPWLDDLDE